MANPNERVAFLGLGIMGSPMAVNLAKAGFDVVGHSRRQVSVEPLLAARGPGHEGRGRAVEGMAAGQEPCAGPH